MACIDRIVVTYVRFWLHGNILAVYRALGRKARCGKSLPKIHPDKIARGQAQQLAGIALIDRDF